MALAAETVMAQTRAQIEPALRDAVGRLDPANRLVVEYHLGFSDAAGLPTDAGGAIAAGGGKAVRGGLAVLSAQAVAAPGDVATAGAVACELVHNFSLLHDDIIDNDATRRHRPTAWTVFGQSAAILAGDAMAALANEVLLEAPVATASSVGPPGAAAAARLLAVATRRMVAGQAADIALESADTVDVQQCQQMAADKTGALLACAASIGATLADAPDAVTSSLAAFGHHLGMAFQLVDDLLGIWGAPERTGKSAASDLAARKKSLPVVAALQAGGPGADRLRALYAHEVPLTVQELAAAAAAVEEAGGRAWAQAEADRETAAALDMLDQAAIDDDVRGRLRAVTAMLCARDH